MKKSTKKAIANTKDDILRWKRRIFYFFFLCALTILLSYIIEGAFTRNPEKINGILKTIQVTTSTIFANFFKLDLIQRNFILLEGLGLIIISIIFYSKRWKTGTSIFLALFLAFFFFNRDITNFFYNKPETVMISILYSFLIFLVLVLFSKRGIFHILRYFKFITDKIFLIFIIILLKRRILLKAFIVFWATVKAAYMSIPDNLVSISFYLLISLTIFFLILTQSLSLLNFQKTLEKNKKNSILLYKDLIMSKKFKEHKDSVSFRIDTSLHYNKRKAIHDDFYESLNLLCVSELGPITIIVPAYKEEGTIVKTIVSLLRLAYPSSNVTIIVVLDGSTDKTEQVMMRAFNMNHYHLSQKRTVRKTKKVLRTYKSARYNNLYMIYKDNGRKHDALNCGLNYAPKNTMFVCNIDADTKPHKLAIALMVKVLKYNPELAAVSGTIIPSYTPKKPRNFLEYVLQETRIMFAKCQQNDYLSSFLVSRGANNILGTHMIVSGGIGVFRFDVLLKVKGYKNAMGEDMYLTLDIASLNSKCSGIYYEPNAIAYTAAPLTVREFIGQRKRWFKGAIECLWAFKGLLFSRHGFTYFKFLFMEIINPLLMPFGLLMLLVDPTSAKYPIFIVSVVGIMLLSLSSTLLGYAMHRKLGIDKTVNIYNIFVIPFQIILATLSLLWRNDAFLELSNKDWGDIKKTFD